MKRSAFIKRMAFAAVACSFINLEELLPKVVQTPRIPIAELLDIDYVERRITLKGNGRYKLQELYTYLNDRWDEPEMLDMPLPITRVDRSITSLAMQDGWHMTPESMALLEDGTLEQRRNNRTEIYTSFVVINNINLKKV